jgi:hypothetical protein
MVPLPVATTLASLLRERHDVSRLCWRGAEAKADQHGRAKCRHARYPIHEYHDAPPGSLILNARTGNANLRSYMLGVKKEARMNAEGTARPETPC